MLYILIELHSYVHGNKNALKKSKDYALGKTFFHIDIYLDFSRKSININEYISEKMFFFSAKTQRNEIKQNVIDCPTLGSRLGIPETLPFFQSALL